MDEEVRRLLRRVAEDETLPPSTVSDAELVERCQAATKSPRDRAVTALHMLRRAVNSLRPR